ncbi:hypothetical protein LTI14_10645 [Nesterenkonia sp. YGD6]|uniref:hypothetical protein n=1 Tax=Nesterenkonia sp. YGD6 TaxID=2901231 RepID=UPI001F4CFFF1|nr:hypothetical protein [Nesterenkonia sp. YGD6]MCH8563668.1 hypothetical protein [Nesterenkonia sp. YGD6]
MSTARYGRGDDAQLKVRVLCPLCHLIHTHGGGTLKNPSLGGRSGHCGNSMPRTGPRGYDMAWPDDAGAQLLNSEMNHCHTIRPAHGNLCSSKVSMRHTAGFQCKYHELNGAAETRRAIDTSSIVAAKQESIYTPRFDILSGRSVPTFERMPK